MNGCDLRLMPTVACRSSGLTRSVRGSDPVEPTAVNTGLALDELGQPP